MDFSTDFWIVKIWSIQISYWLQMKLGVFSHSESFSITSSQDFAFYVTKECTWLDDNLNYHEKEFELLWLWSKVWNYEAAEFQGPKTKR